MTNPKISVIVPIYNVELYLEKCVNSIVNQTYKNIEIILVDDGSSDSSGRISDELSLSDNRIKVVHKKNGGLSDARNTGISISTGDLLCFIDSDDYIENDMIELLYKNLINFNADISVCSYIMEYKNKNVIIANGNEIKVYNKEEALKNSLLVNDIGMISCNKLFKKELFKGILYPLGQAFEDINTIYKVLNASNVIVYDPTPKYYYVQRDSSINGQNFKAKEFNEKLYDLYDASMEVYNFIKKSYPQILGASSIGCINYNLRVINNMITHNVVRNDIIKTTKEIIEENKKSLKNISLLKRIQFKLFYINYGLYKFIIKNIYKKRK